MKAIIPVVASTLVLACASAVHAHPPCQNAVAARGSVTVEVTDGDGRKLPAFNHHSDVWVLGQRGDRYRVRVKNHGGQRLEAVVSVDGRDAIDGQAASWQKRGYIVPAWGEVVVDGFRLSSEQVAAFRFSSVKDSYAAKTGSARDVGVIGVAVFRERSYPRPEPKPIEPRWNERSDNDKRSPSKSAPPAGAPTTSDRSSAEGKKEKDSRSGLGTAFGERRTSPVRQVSFVRASARPDHLIALRYNDEDGLLAQGVDLACRGRWTNEAHVRRTAKPFVEAPRTYAAPPPGWED